MLPKKIIFFIFSFFLFANTNAQVYYVSSSQGSDLNDGLSIQSPFQSIEKLNSMQFNPGDSIYFKSGDYWEGMFWLKGSGSLNQPITVDVYGGQIIDQLSMDMVIKLLFWFLMTSIFILMD